MTTTVRQAIGLAAARLHAAGIDNPRLEARLLLAHSRNAAAADLLRDLNAPVDMTGLEPLIARREAREPLAHIVGRREFWSLEFAVSPATLIPRPESETLIEAAVAAFADAAPPRQILDLGTGTGCLLLAALAEFPTACGVGVDRSAAAAALAAYNAAALGMADRAHFICGNWADALDGPFDLILCNPPYIATADLAGLMPEVAKFEPRTALDGGADGFDAYRHLLPTLPQLLTQRGVAVVELGAGQAATAKTLTEQANLRVELRSDLAGIPRALVLRLVSP